MRYLDTNIFIRYLTGDDPVKQEACERLFLQLKEGEELATTTESVIAEVMYVLTSSRWYGLPRTEAANILDPLLQLNGLRLFQRSRYLRALDLYRTHSSLDFEDALLAAHIEGPSDTVVSYDRDFDRVPEVVRVEP